MCRLLTLIIAPVVSEQCVIDRLPSAAAEQHSGGTSGGHPCSSHGQDWWPRGPWVGAELYTGKDAR